MIDQLKPIAIFQIVVDHGSFRSAAKALRMSPSVVSHHVSQLEQALGTALMYRSTRKLALTEEGKRLITHARNMVEAAETGLQEVSTRSEQPTGALNLTIPAVLSRSKLVDRIAQFTRKYPGVQLSMDFSDVRRDLIGDGFDIAIRMGWLSDSSHKARKLFEVKRSLVASKTYLNSKPEPKTIDELSTWDWLELAPVWNKAETFKHNDHKQVVLKPKARISVNDANALGRLSGQGAGLAVIPDFLAEPEIASGLLREVFPDWAAEPVGVYAVWPPNAPRDGLIKRFVDHLASGLRD